MPLAITMITMPPGVDSGAAKVKFNYSELDPADPQSISTSTETIPHTSESITLYEPGAGAMRIWTQDADVARNSADVNQGGHYVKPGEWYAPANLPDLYVEGIAPGETGKSRGSDAHVRFVGCNTQKMARTAAAQVMRGRSKAFGTTTFTFARSRD